jgi:hypothetical protein
VELTVGTDCLIGTECLIDFLPISPMSAHRMETARRRERIDANLRTIWVKCM